MIARRTDWPILGAIRFFLDVGRPPRSAGQRAPSARSAETAGALTPDPARRRVVPRRPTAGTHVCQPPEPAANDAPASLFCAWTRSGLEIVHERHVPRTGRIGHRRRGRPPAGVRPRAAHRAMLRDAEAEALDTDEAARGPRTSQRRRRGRPPRGAGHRRAPPGRTRRAHAGHSDAPPATPSDGWNAPSGTSMRLSSTCSTSTLRRGSDVVTGLEAARLPRPRPGAGYSRLLSNETGRASAIRARVALHPARHGLRRDDRHRGSRGPPEPRAPERRLGAPPRTRGAPCVDAAPCAA